MPKCLPFWLPDGDPEHEVWKHRGWAAGRPSWQGRRGTRVSSKEPCVRNRRLELSFQLVLLYDLEPPLFLAEPHSPHADGEVAGPIDSQGPTSSDTLNSRVKETTDISKERQPVMAQVPRASFPPGI